MTDSLDSTKPQIQAMLEASSLWQVGSGTHYSGDGTWTEADLVCAVVDAGGKKIALAKAAAAFGNRDNRPDPFFSYEKTDTFELALDLESLSLVFPDTPWAAHEPVAEIDTDAGGKALEQLYTDVETDSDGAVGYNERGELLSSKAAIEEEIDSFDSAGWIIVGLSLKPTGAGNDHGQYIGESYTIHCADCGSVSGECKNIICLEEADEHIGIWECSQCSNQFRGPHPKGPAHRDVISDD